MHQFLNRFRVSRGQDYTHTSLARPAGSFFVPASASDAFLSEYVSSLNRGDDLFLTERHRHIGPVVVDLDFRYAHRRESDVSGGGGGESSSSTSSSPAPPIIHRHHDTALVDRIVSVYFDALSALVDLSHLSSVDCYVLEKPCPTLVKGVVKDGLHMIFPGISTRASVQHLLRQDVLKTLGPILSESLPDLTSPIEDVVDEAVIEKNNWMMYGSRKPGSDAYTVTSRYTMDVQTGGVEVTTGVDGLSDGVLVDLFSIRNKYDELSVVPGSLERLAEYERVREDARLRREAVQRVVSSISNTRTNTCDNLELVSKLVMILSPSRVESYPDWVRLGWCLRNIDHRLLDAWVEASKRSPKYVDGECHRIWNAMRVGGLGQGTLHMWARNDSPAEYRELLRLDLRDLLKTSVTGTHYDVAKVVHHLYKYEFSCSNIRTRTWWEFRNHRWRQCDSAYSLRMRLSTDVFREYLAYKTHVTQHASAISDDEQQKELIKLSKQIADLALKLKVTSFKDNVLRECAELFYIEKFEDKLDSDLDLIGFENGVYDLDRAEFRDGRPDDHVSFSTGVNYIPFDADHEIVADIRRFWSSVHPEPEIRDYVLTTLASCMSGRIREERFHIWTGTGCHARGTLVRLFDGSTRAVEDVAVGDRLAGDDCTPRTVLRLFRGHGDMWTVRPTPDDSGAPFIVNGDHVLSLASRSGDIIDVCVVDYLALGAEERSA